MNLIKFVLNYTKITVFISIYTILVVSCHNKDGNIERIDINTEIVSDSIYSRMPGTLLKIDNYLVWQDSYNSEYFMHIIDLDEKTEIGIMGKIGQGPGEFNTPVISSTVNKNIFVFDLNSNHQAFYSIDSLNSNRNPYIQYRENDQKNITKKIRIGEDQFITLQPSEYMRFKLISENDFLEFGPPFIKGEDFENKYSINQGAIKFHPKRNKLVFASYRFPYIEIYDIIERDISLLFSNSIPKELYTRTGAKIKTNPSRSGCLDMTLTKDYIVTIQRDYQIDNTDESTVGMDFEKVPQTLFLYNYDGNIRKIVNLGIPVFKVAGDTKSNTIYAVGSDPEFLIVKCEL